MLRERNITERSAWKLHRQTNYMQPENIITNCARQRNRTHANKYKQRCELGNMPPGNHGNRCFHFQCNHHNEPVCACNNATNRDNTNRRNCLHGDGDSGNPADFVGEIFGNGDRCCEEVMPSDGIGLCTETPRKYFGNLADDKVRLQAFE